MSTLEQLFGLRDKVVVVTGATGQLGTALVGAFAEVGARVYGTDKVLPGGKPTSEERIRYLPLDITSRTDVDRVFREILAAETRIDVLVNNAGVSCFEPFQERPEESFDWVMDVNLKGTFFCIQSYAKLAIERCAPGSIVNIGSMYGVISPDLRIYTDLARQNSEVYGATKAGIIAMTRYFGANLAKDRIRINCVSPGGIFNPASPQGPDFLKNYAFRCPMGRMAESREMVGAVLYLASDAASYTTGQNLVVDGGMSCW